MVRLKPKKQKATPTVAAAPAPAPPGLPPMGGVPQVSSDVSAQARGKNTVDTMVDTTVDVVDPHTARSESHTKRSSEATPPSVVEAAYDKSLVAILRFQQEEYWDHMDEMKNVGYFISNGRLRLRYLKGGTNVLDPTLFDKIETKLANACARLAHLEEGLPKCQIKCEKARAALTGEDTVSIESDPADWQTDGFPEKLNRWVEPEDEKKDERYASAKSGSQPESSSGSSDSSSSGSSDSSDELTSSNKSDAPVSNEVRQQRIVNTRRFYVLNRARWLRGELDGETWEQVGAPEDSHYFKDVN